MKFLFLLCCVLSFGMTSGAALADRGLDFGADGGIEQFQHEKRVALVIGNANYARWSSLANPLNDARSMADTLARYGFEVIRVEDGTRQGMLAAVRQFGEALADSGVGLFYYAGHGTQAYGENYMIPVDADIVDEDDIRSAGIGLQDIFARFERSENRLNMMILDACRTFPVRRSTRSGGEGLARVNAPSGTLIAYATAPNQVAKDGAGRHSPYTEALVDTINRHPGLKIEDLFKAVGTTVRSQTGGAQQPWIESSIEGDFFFDPEQIKTATVIINTPTVRPAAPQAAAQPADPRARLAGMGIAWNSESFGDALMNADLAALELFFAGGWNPLSRYDEGNALAHFLWLSDLDDTGRIEQVLRLFVAAGVDPAAKVIRFRRLDPMDLASAAALACNAAALEAALKVGGNKRLAIASIAGQRGISPPPDGVPDCSARIDRIGTLLGMRFHCRPTAWDRTGTWCEISQQARRAEDG